MSESEGKPWLYAAIKEGWLRIYKWLFIGYWLHAGWILWDVAAILVRRLFNGPA